MTYAPFTLAWDDHLPIDISFVFTDEKPAGKHGFLTVCGDQFCFEDGTPARFWGTNFNSGANFPPHKQSEMVSRRLAKFGVNIVRTHQMDAEWATPNIFTSNRAIPKTETRTLDAECLDRLDYLIHCLKKDGIYIYLDLLTYRQFLPGDGVESCEKLPQAAKPYLYFDPRLIELQKEFSATLWHHLNPYTGLAYKDDPAIALVELVNEADFFAHPVTVEPYRSHLEEQYRAWLDTEYLPQPQTVDFTQPDPVMARFCVQVMQTYNRSMVAHLRELGVRIPITGTNWSINLGVTAAQREMDFTDSHGYWNYPWGDPPGTVTRTPMVASAANDFVHLCLMRLPDRPFFVSEWDHAYPAEYRAESSLALAAVAALQGWGGCAIHTYRYSTWQPENRIAGGSSTIHGVIYRNFFDSFNDPAKFGLFYHAALILRRGDVSPAVKKAAIQIPDSPGWELLAANDIRALQILPEVHQLSMALPGSTPETPSLSIPPQSRADLVAGGEVRSDTGQLWRSWERRFGTVDSPRSKVAYGFLGAAGKISLENVAFLVSSDYAVLALSSLTNDPLPESPSILLTAVGRCENSDTCYDENHQRILSAGKPPTMIEVIEAEIWLHSQHAQLKVFAISEHGELIRRLPVDHQQGRLHFLIGMPGEWVPATMYYLIRI